MIAPVKLIPLKCVRCATPVPASPGQVAWVCEQCGQGLLLDEDQGLSPLDIHYNAGHPQGKTGNPYWVARGMVSVRRETHESFFDRDRESAEFWSKPHQFFVPGFDCNLDRSIQLGISLLRNPPLLRPGSSFPSSPVTLSREDVMPLAEFIVMAIEAERKDNIKTISFSLDLSEPVLWILTHENN